MVTRFSIYTGSIVSLLLLLFLQPLSAQEDAFYKIETLEIPKEMNLEIGGQDFLPDGRLIVCTRRGEVWIINDPYQTSFQENNFTRFAHGLHEPLGLAYHDGAVYVTQRGELTKLIDEDNDDRADVYDRVAAWPLSGNYHDYSYGPIFLPNGNMLLTFNLSWIGHGASLVKWRGWMVQITPEGKIEPMATGMRSPAGFAMNRAGDVFYSDNQGDWVGSGRITHVEKGDFVGHPEGLKWADDPSSPVKVRAEQINDSLGSLYLAKEKVEGVKPPAVWFPHSVMGISTSAILEDNTGSFGPFEGQMFVGDQGHSTIMRMFLEKVKGEYQGACFPFRKGFSSGVLRFSWGKPGSLFVGMTNRGWASTGKEPFGIQRLVWTGKMPFEMQTIHAQPDGFELTFTQSVDAATAGNPASYSIQGFTYKYHHIYGSPIEDMQPCIIKEAIVSADKRRVHLVVEGLREGYVHEIKVPGVRNGKKQPLLHDFAYYTLNNLPEGATAAANTSNSGNAEIANAFPKRVTDMPSDWTNGPDQTVNIGTVPGMKYDQTTLEVKAGSKVKLNFNNNDDMQHNWVLVKPGTADQVAEKAIALGISGPNASYIPQSEDVITHTVLLQPETAESIYFVAPTKPGTYTYVCTVPGHHVVMRGVLEVK